MKSRVSAMACSRGTSVASGFGGQVSHGESFSTLMALALGSVYLDPASRVMTRGVQVVHALLLPSRHSRRTVCWKHDTSTAIGMAAKRTTVSEISLSRGLTR